MTQPTSPLPIHHVYEMNEYEWWMASSPEEAERDFLKSGGFEKSDEAIDPDCPRRLTDEELARLTFVGERREVGRLVNYKQSFGDELRQREQKSQYFATSEI